MRKFAPPMRRWFNKKSHQILREEQKVQETAARVDRARVAAARAAGPPTPRAGSRLAAALEDIDPPWHAPPPPTTAVGWLVEQQVKQAQARGVMDNLAGHGKPLAQRADDMDAGQAALNRLLKNAGFKPPSVEAREEMARARKRRDALIASAVSSGATWEEIASSPRGTEARAAHAALEGATKAFNSVLIIDRENYGSAWPLHQSQVESFSDAVRAALDRRAKGHGEAS